MRGGKCTWREDKAHWAKWFHLPGATAGTGA